MIDRFVVIVDAYSTGNSLAGAFRRHNIRAIHVQSTLSVPGVYKLSFNPEDFVALLVNDGDIRKIVDSLSSFSVVAVVPGAESGVTLADELAERLELPRNVYKLSSARRSKELMVEAAARGGLLTAASFVSDRIEKLTEWAEQRDKWPVVVKPLASAGTDGVSFCHNVEDIRGAFFSIYGHVNPMGLLNDRVMIQSFLAGQEYFINTVSRDGIHVVVEIWREHKKRIGGAIDVYDLETLLPYDGEAQSKLIAYTEKLLSALGVRNGPAHTELMFTEDGVALIELGARLQGSMAEASVARALGESQVTLTALAYADPASFRERAKHGYTMKSNCWAVGLISSQCGTVLSCPGVDDIKHLSSFDSIIKVLAPGDSIGETKNLWSSPGIVYLMHRDDAVMQADYDKIRLLESQQRIFTVSSERLLVQPSMSNV